MTITHREPRKDLAVSNDDSQPQKKGRKNPNWPTLLQRMQWAYERTVAMGLNGVEAAIFKHVVYTDGIGEGFFQHQKTIAQETGWKHAAISRALGKLVEKGLLEATPRMGRTTKYCLIGLATMPSEPISERDEPISLRDDSVSLRDDGISERDAEYLSKRQQNLEGNQEDLTSNLLSELSESGEFKNISGTRDQDDDQDQDDPDQDQDDPDVTDDQWKAPLELPNIFRNGITYAKFQGAFHSGELTHDWAHKLSQHAGGMSPQETWAFEEWFDRTHRRTTTGKEYEELLEENIRRFMEEHSPAPVEEA